MSEYSHDGNYNESVDEMLARINSYPIDDDGFCLVPDDDPFLPPADDLEILPIADPRRHDDFIKNFPFTVRDEQGNPIF